MEIYHKPIQPDLSNTRENSGKSPVTEKTKIPHASGTTEVNAPATKQKASIQISDASRELNQAVELGTSLAQEIPIVDPKRVQAAKDKIENGTLDAIGDLQQRLESAERIANKILQEHALFLDSYGKK